jgi:hypothetical protein
MKGGGRRLAQTLDGFLCSGNVQSYNPISSTVALLLSREIERSALSLYRMNYKETLPLSEGKE